MTTIPRAIIDGERDGYHTVVEPKDAATLIIVDRAGAEPKVLLGRRHMRHVFMPGKYVFPGGRVDPVDRAMPVATPLNPDTVRKLLANNRLRGRIEAQALALAAIRETFEETGLVIGAKVAAAGYVPPGPWSAFSQVGYAPDLSAVQFIARAITPPGFPRRFDARFFCADAESIAHRVPNVVHADAELVELIWLPIVAAMELDLPVITALVLQELQARLRPGTAADAPVPFYHTMDDEFSRNLIE